MSKSVAIMGTRGYPSYYGGFETAVRWLAPYLADRGWDVTVYNRPGETATADSTRHPAVKTVETAGLRSKRLSTLSYGWTSALHAARNPPDVAIVMNVANGYFLRMLQRRGTAVLVNVDGIEWEREKWGWFARLIFRGGARQTAKHADELAVDAIAIGERWEQTYGRRGTFIPYGGVIPQGDLPLEPGLRTGGYALYVARFVPENSFAQFFEAARAVSANHQVVIVGSGSTSFNDAAAALASAEPNVRWLGHISDDERLHGLWQHAGVYFHGHSVGGTNPALVQAMACGAPIVARDTVFNREVLGADGTFVAAEATDIAAALTSVLSNTATQQKLRADSRARAQAHYSWDSVCAQYESALLALLEAR